MNRRSHASALALLSMAVGSINSADFRSLASPSFGGYSSHRGSHHHTYSRAKRDYARDAVRRRMARKSRKINSMKRRGVY